jgi:F0F1-type ATP synthase assembly protein I
MNRSTNQGGQKSKKGFWDSMPKLMKILQELAYPLIAGVIFGILIYAFVPGITGIIIGTVFALFGLVVGIIAANRASRSGQR